MNTSWLCMQGALWVGALGIVPSIAWAQDIPKGTQKGASVSEGKTELVQDQFQAAVRDEEKTKDATELALSAGGVQSGGNARLLAGTATAKFRLRRDENQFRAAVAGNYGRTAAPHEDWATTVQNVQGLVRYDRFLGDFTLFVSSQSRNDRFQGLVLREQFDPGFGYYLLNQKRLLLWGELGYDLTYDIRRDDSRTVLDDAGHASRLEKTTDLHSGRAFLGFEQSLWGSKLVAGVEYLQGLSDTSKYRINSDLSLNTKIGGNFSVAFAVSERYERHPLPGKESLDTATSFSLVYTLL